LVSRPASASQLKRKLTHRSSSAICAQRPSFPTPTYITARPPHHTTTCPTTAHFARYTALHYQLITLTIMADREQPYDPYIPTAGQPGAAGQGQNGNHRTAALQAVCPAHFHRPSSAASSLADLQRQTACTLCASSQRRRGHILASRSPAECLRHPRRLATAALQHHDPERRTC
jgi:hypothetical protein